MGRVTPYWEENGFTTEWYWHQHRMRSERLDDAELTRIIAKHGEQAIAELTMLAGSGNFNRYVGALERITTKAPAPEADLPLFAAQ